MRTPLRPEWTNLVTSALAVAVSVPTSLVVARALGPEGRGLFAIITMASAIVALVAAGGLPDVVPTLIRRGADDASVRTVRDRLLTRAAIVGGIWALAAPWLTRPFGVADSALDLGIVLALAPLVILGALWPLRLQWSSARGDVRLASGAELARVIAYAVFVVGLAIAGWLTTTLAVVAFAAAYGAVLLAIGWPSAVRGAEPAPIDPADRRLARDGMLSRLTEYAATRLDVLLVGAFVDVESAGWYAVAVGLADLVTLPANAVTAPVLAAVVAGDTASVRQFVAQRTGLAMLGTLAGGALLAVVATPVVVLAFGAPFGAAVSPLRVLALGAAFTAGARVRRVVNLGRGRVADTRRADLIATLLLVVGIAVITPHFGIVGAAAVAVVAQGVLLALLWSAARGQGPAGSDPARPAILV